MKCQACLPDTASAGQREQTRVRKRGPDCGELAAASDEARQLGWQVASRFAGGKLCHLAAPYHAPCAQRPIPAADVQYVVNR